MSRDVSPEERRGCPRRQAEGTVRLLVETQNGAGLELSGELVDVSATGFRCRHQCTTLSGGDRVRFADAERSGYALVVWTRVLGGAAESGFRLE